MSTAKSQHKPPNEKRPDYKKTKIGWIPEKWEIKCFGSIADIQLGKMLSGKAKKGINPKPYLANYNVRWGSFALNKVQTMDFSEREESKYALQEGDLIVCEGGEVGRCAIWKEEISPCYYQKALHRVRANEKEAIPLYLMYFINQAVQQSHMVLYIGESSIAHFTREQFLKFPIPLPSLAEQKKIAEILGCWDEGLESLDKLIEAKKLRKKGLMQKLLTGEKRLPAFQKSKSGGSGSEWKEVRLGDILQRVEPYEKLKSGESYPLVSIRRKAQGIFGRGVFPRENISYPEMARIKLNDFLISKRQVSHGAYAMVSEKFVGCYVSREYVILESKNAELHMLFIKWLSEQKLLWHKGYVSSNGVHIEKLILDPKHFLKHTIAIPPTLEEQQAIAEVLETADKEIRLLEAEHATLTDQRKGLMQKLLTGEVRVHT